jgi:hypothetical protein
VAKKREAQMVIGPGLDKLNLIFPGKMRLDPTFARHWNNEANIKLLKIRPGEGYAKTGDLRGVNIDARLSCGLRFNDKAGVKLEIFEVGKKAYSEIDAVLRQVMHGDVNDGEFSRVDLTADLTGIRVNEVERAMYVRFKQTSQTEYADGVTRNFRRGRGDTIYFGRGGDQVRVYNKTEHRKVLLAKENARRRRHGYETKTFFEEYGYEPTEIRTRVERQCGERGTDRLWGIKRWGEVHRLADVDPFANFRFVGDVKRGKDFRELEPRQQLLLDLLRDYSDRHSVAETRTMIKQYYDNPRVCRKFLQNFERFWMHQTVVTGELLKMRFRESIVAQLAA